MSEVIDAQEPLQEVPQEQAEQQSVSEDSFAVAVLVGVDLQGQYSMRVLGRQKSYEGVLSLLEYMKTRVNELSVQQFKSSPELAIAQELHTLKNQMAMLMSAVQELREPKVPQA